MLVLDFEINQITDFTPGEIEATGADLNEMQSETICALQKFKNNLQRNVFLDKDGLTSGRHKNPEHKAGRAVDCQLAPAEGNINFHLLFKAAIKAGFKGIGLYWNQEFYKLHLDLRLEFKFWGGVKDESKNINDWQWYPLLNDISKINL